MAKPTKTKGLGRGLSALLADVEDVPQSRPQQSSGTGAGKMVPIESVHANKDQPRRDFDPDDLADLARSVGEKGIIQPIVVRVDPDDINAYQIVAGERRWRAAQAAKLHQVPVIIRELDDGEVLELAIIENIQRADLNAIEEALGFRQLMDKFGHTQEKLAEALGKSRSYIANLLRLLNLPADVVELVRAGKLSAGHARALVPADNPSELARMIVSKGLSVRQTELLAKRQPTEATKTQKPKAYEKDADTRAIEGDLSAHLGLKVDISQDPEKESGKVTISYRTLDQLDGLFQLLTK